MGALINALAILLGGVVGLCLGNKIPRKISNSVMRTLGLPVLLIGISGGLKGDVMLMTACIAAGSFCGEILNIDGSIGKLGEFLEKKFSRKNNDADTSKKSFSTGFVNATLLFCVGSMSIIGSLDAGMGDLKIINAKSVLDGVSAMIYSSIFGVGVLFSAVLVFVYQGIIELSSSLIKSNISYGFISELSAVGNLMIIAIALNLIFENTKIKTANLLPSLLFVIPYYYLVIAR